MGVSSGPDERTDASQGAGGGRDARLALPLAGIAVLGSVAAVIAGVSAGAAVLDLGGVVVVIVATAVGAVVVRAQARNPVGWLLLGSGVALAIADAGAQLARVGVPGAPWLAWVGMWSRSAAIFALFGLVPLHFPDGLPPGAVWRRVRRAAVGMLVVAAALSGVQPGSIQLTALPNPLGIQALEPFGFVVIVLLVAVLLAAVASLVYRYRHGSRRQRDQVKWLAYVVALWLVFVLASGPAAALDPLLGSTVHVVMLVVGAALPVAVGIAVLRHRLYDIDLIISRTLVYGGLTVGVVALYVVAVGYLGALLQARGSFLVSLLATGIVAVAFSPLRERLQRAANRLVYGDRDDPYAALERLGQRLDETASPQQLLDLAAQEVADALRLRYAAVEVATPSGRMVVAEHGSAPAAGRVARIPLHPGGTTVGWLTVGPLREGDELTAADRGLLEALARPVGVTLHARELAAELQRSRQALVTAREAERSRLHRDLHDGLGPELATVSMLAEAARGAVRPDPTRAESLLDDVIEGAQQAVTDLRHVVHALRPPALDALGLGGALRAYAETHTRGGLRTVVDVAEPLPVLPAAVEVAVYRIAVEAITNVTRHADATVCTLSLSAAGDCLLLEVMDDGRGLGVDATPGVGLVSIQTRAAELGGQCAVTAGADGGTAVRARLPLPSPAGADAELSRLAGA